MARDVWGNTSIWGPGKPNKPKKPKKAKPTPPNARNPMAKYAGGKKDDKKKTPNVRGVYPRAYTPIGIDGRPLDFTPVEPDRGFSGIARNRPSRIPDGHWERMERLKKKHQKAQRDKNRNRGRGGSGGGSGSGGSGGGGGGGGGGGSQPPRTTPTPGRPTTPAPEVADFDIASLFAPARKAIENQRVDIQQRRDASMKAWNDFNAWAEQKRAESAGLITSANAEQARLVNENRAAADARIADLVGAARGRGEGAAVAGGDLAAATGADALAQSQAALGKGEQANADWTELQGRLANQDIQTRQQINNALQAEGHRNVELGASKAFTQNDKDLASLENTIAAAKLDQYNRDRSYELDKTAAEWLRTYQQKGLDLQGRQLDASIANQEAQSLLAQMQARNATITANNATLQQGAKNNEKAREMLQQLAEGFNDLNPHEQGQLMQSAAKQLYSLYKGVLSKHDAQLLMGAVFGPRFNNRAKNGYDANRGKRSAVHDFVKIWK